MSERMSQVLEMNQYYRIKFVAYTNSNLEKVCLIVTKNKT